MDLFKKYFDNTSILINNFDYVANYLHLINEKPMSSILVPVTLSLLCYYIYIYVRKFYPIRVNCWFCNANFKVAFEDRFEYTCIECGQFNGFKKDGSYTKIIPEQHDHRYNRTIFTVNQNEKIKESKNGLCHKCNIIQEMKVKQLASFAPIDERNFDKEVEKFKENLEATLNLCSKCNQHTRKILSLQEKHYNLNSFRMNNRMDKQNVSSWYNICSLCLSSIVVLLSSGVENYFDDWAAAEFDKYTFIPHNSFMTIARFISIASLTGTICQVYQCLSTLDKLSAVIMLLWSLLFVVENIDILEHLKPKLLISVLIVLLSSASIIRNLTRKQKIRQTNIKLDEKYQFNTTNYYDNMSTNGSFKNSDESEMMDIDRVEKTPKKKTLYKNVNNLFRGMQLNDNQSMRNNIIRPPKFIMPIKRYKRIPGGGYAESSPGGYYTSPFSIKDDYEFDTQSIFSQDSYKTQCLSLCHHHQSAVAPYTFYTSPYYNQPTNQLNSSHSSNTSNVQQQQQTVEWTKMLIYSIPGIVLFGLQCYLLNDIKDFMKQK